MWYELFLPHFTSMATKASLWTLSPSDFGYLWRECPKCFYLKVTQKASRPGVFPRIFGAIDGQMRLCFDGQRTEKLLPALPPGVFDCADQWVKSAPITLSGHTSICQVRGKIDSYIRFDDGSFAVIDFKTSARSDDNINIYSHQLHAYAYALENAAPGNLSLKPIRRLGLLVFEPNAFAAHENNGATFSGSLTWMEIPRNDKVFLNFVGEVMALLESPSIPNSAPACPYCTYRETFRAKNW